MVQSIAFAFFITTLGGSVIETYQVRRCILRNEVHYLFSCPLAEGDTNFFSANPMTYDVQ